MTDPPASGVTAALQELCRTLGVQLGHEFGGSFRAAPTESVVAALRALGAPLDGPDSAGEALRAVRSGALDALVPPTAVSWTDDAPWIPLHLPAAAAATPVEVELVLEDGSRAGRIVDPGEIRWTEESSGSGGTGSDGGARGSGRTGPDSGARRAGRLPLPETLPPGYHEIRLSAAGRTGRSFLVRAPRTTWSPEPAGAGPSKPPHRRRRWATFLPLHALRSARGWGAGDLADLRALAEWTAERGGGWVGTLPLYDTFLGSDPSPYAPVSRQFWNPLWIALEDAPGLDAAPEARTRLENGEMLRRAGELRAADAVDYRAVMALKRRVLEALAEAHRGDGPHGLSEPLARWVQDDPEALAYARFRAAVEATGGPWSQWRGSARGGDAGSLDPPDAAVRYHVYAQWAVQSQLDGLADDASAGLYLDLPLGSHPDGFDHWRHQEIFARDFSVGAPPDAFFEGGQDWGFPPLHPHRIREEGHGYWASCLGRTMAVADVLRLDHVMSLHRIFWIPRGAGAAEGVYVRYPADELWAVLCLESHRHETEVVGEDLGTVPPEVPRAMERHGARRMWVLPFEVAANGGEAAAPGYRVRPPDTRSVASLNTHDLPTFAAFLDGTDIDARLDEGELDAEQARAEREARAHWRAALVACLRDRGHLDPEGGEPRAASDPDTATLLRGALRFLASSDADTVLVSLEDLWLETEPQNIPGTPSTANWRRKARLSLEEMTSDPGVRDLLELVERRRNTPDSSTSEPGTSDASTSEPGTSDASTAEPNSSDSSTSDPRTPPDPWPT